jgi:hypothetical protein
VFLAGRAVAAVTLMALAVLELPVKATQAETLLERMGGQVVVAHLPPDQM